MNTNNIIIPDECVFKAWSEFPVRSWKTFVEFYKINVKFNTKNGRYFHMESDSDSTMFILRWS